MDNSREQAFLNTQAAYRPVQRTAQVLPQAPTDYGVGPLMQKIYTPWRIQRELINRVGGAAAEAGGRYVHPAYGAAMGGAISTVGDALDPVKVMEADARVADMAGEYARQKAAQAGMPPIASAGLGTAAYILGAPSNLAFGAKPIAAGLRVAGRGLEAGGARAMAYNNAMGQRGVLNPDFIKHGGDMGGGLKWKPSDWSRRNMREEIPYHKQLHTMSPPEFLERALPLNMKDPATLSKIAAYRAKFRLGQTPDQMPNLRVSMTGPGGAPVFTGHEGRHRAAALLEEGAERMPVTVEAASSTPFQHLGPEWKRVIEAGSGYQQGVNPSIQSLRGAADATKGLVPAVAPALKALPARQQAIENVKQLPEFGSKKSDIWTPGSKRARDQGTNRLAMDDPITQQKLTKDGVYIYDKINKEMNRDWGTLKDFVKKSDQEPYSPFAVEHQASLHIDPARVDMKAYNRMLLNEEKENFAQNARHMGRRDFRTIEMPGVHNYIKDPLWKKILKDKQQPSYLTGKGGGSAYMDKGQGFPTTKDKGVVLLERNQMGTNNNLGVGIHETMHGAKADIIPSRMEDSGELFKGKLEALGVNSKDSGLRHQFTRQEWDANRSMVKAPGGTIADLRNKMPAATNKLIELSRRAREAGGGGMKTVGKKIKGLTQEETDFVRDAFQRFRMLAVPVVAGAAVGRGQAIENTRSGL